MPKTNHHYTETKRDDGTPQFNLFDASGNLLFWVYRYPNSDTWLSEGAMVDFYPKGDVLAQLEALHQKAA